MLGFGKKRSRTSLRFQAWTMSASFISTLGLRRLIPIFGSTSTGHSPVEIYFRLSKRYTSGLSAGLNGLALKGGGLYMVHSLQSKREGWDPVSCRCSGETIGLTLLTKRSSILSWLQMTPEEMTNVMKLMLSEVIRLMHSRDGCSST